jgi:hypothetical protein
MYKQDKTIINCKKEKGDRAYSSKQSKVESPYKKQRKSKNNPNPKLTKEQKEFNSNHNRERVEIEHTFSCIKKFKITSEKYRNRRKKFKLRFNLICCFYNLDLESKGF